jgi:hypothetical protein
VVASDPPHGGWEGIEPGDRGDPRAAVFLLVHLSVTEGSARPCGSMRGVIIAVLEDADGMQQ